MKPYLLLLLALPLSACISFGAKPPPSLMTITATERSAAGAARNVTAAEAIAIAIPVAPQAIATTRIPVSVGATAIAYVEKAAWVETPARLFQRLLSETIGVRTGKIVLDPKQAALAPASQLSGQLLRFGVDEPTNEAVVVYDAVLSRNAGKTVVTRRFEARSNLSSITAGPVGEALNKAANQVAGDVADWINEAR